MFEPAHYGTVVVDYQGAPVTALVCHQCYAESGIPVAVYDETPSTLEEDLENAERHEEVAHARTPRG